MRPMLACAAPADLRFPIYASAKLDGVRCVVKDGVALSRSLKPIPNRFIQECLGRALWDGFDGELIVGHPGAADVYRRTNSEVMSRDGEPDFMFYTFDHFAEPTKPYCERLEMLQGLISANRPTRIGQLKQAFIRDAAELAEFEQLMLAQGFEGLMVRGLDAPYKFGRSTEREHYLMKLKRFSDGEARIVGFEELMHNGNAVQLDELGQVKRSSHQANLTPMDTLGALHVEDCGTGVAFKIGTGYTAQHRKQIWQARAQLLGAIVKYKHFEIGVKDAPRFPVWLGFRDPIDM